MIDQQIDIATRDGKTTTFITHPERGGPFPVILFYMDAPAPAEIIERVKQGMKGSNNEVEIYPGTHHGFAFPKRPVYNRDAAERHW